MSEFSDQPPHQSEDARPPDQPPFPPAHPSPYQAPYQASYQLPPLPPSEPPRPRRRLWWLVGAGAAVAMVIGLVVAFWPGGSSGQRAPFDAAVADLAQAHAVHQTASLGFADWDLQVTSTGESTGTMNLGGLSFQLLAVGGDSYIKPPDGLLPGGATTKLPASFLKGKWVKADSAMLGSATSQVGTPAAIAGKLRDALKSATFPSSLHATDTVDGTPAIKATGKTGDLYVSASKPYHVLRFDPRLPGGQQLPSLPKVPSLSNLPSLPGMPSMPRMPSLPNLPTHRLMQFADPAPAGLTMDISPEAAAQVVQTYKNIEDDVQQLKNVVDAGIDAHADGPAQLDCGAGGCEVSAKVDVKFARRRQDRRRAEHAGHGDPERPAGR